MFNSTKEIKKLIADHERMAAELKEMLAKKEAEEAEEAGRNKIPDDVRDIPTTYPVEAYSKTPDGKGVSGFYVNAVGAILKHWHDTINDTTCINFESNFTFPTYDFAEMFREKAQLITDCVFFKWFYDRDYVPKWGWNKNKNWGVWYDTFYQVYDAFSNNLYDENQVYFSTREVAEKCAEWLNYKYKKGEYSEAHD